MKKPYTIRRADFFEAIVSGYLPKDNLSILHAGSIWMTLTLTKEQAQKYAKVYPINEGFFSPCGN
jgi:hypothetical protein